MFLGLHAVRTAVSDPCRSETLSVDNARSALPIQLIAGAGSDQLVEGGCVREDLRVHALPEWRRGQAANDPYGRCLR